jgi:galactofuranosylgalactofuranosylrhamnosyl-N-acetylglucosaminyl-diphospho-decaprenol beta-1,5/1,6-galactofuranosyltransferase
MLLQKIESSVAINGSSLTQPVNIQSIIFPNLEICDVEKLFFRSNNKTTFNYDEQVLQMSKGSLVGFDTYFNGFCLDNWKNYTRVQHIGAYLNLKGSFKINIRNVDVFCESKSLISQKIVTTQSLESVEVLDNLNLSNYTGMIYIEAEALDDNCEIKGGHFYSRAEQKNDVKLGIVICTYKREDYVNKNLLLLENLLLNQEGWRDKVEVFVIDNGNTLEVFDSPSIHTIPNKNAGGSGGFARGMLEVLKQQRGFTHLILMDDDIVFHPLIIQHLWNFLSLANQQNLCFGGSMLRLDKKYVQHERGGRWDKDRGFVSVKRDSDLRELKATLFNEVNEHIDYSGWWFFCLPIDSIEQYGLPYPFFIRLDDVEFGIRVRSSYKTIILNGMCVWHEPFENKHSAITEYYYIRNSLIFKSIYHSENFSAISAIKSFLKPILRELFLYRYETASTIVKAVRDYLNGPDFLENMNPASNHKDVSQFTEKAVKNDSLNFIYSKYVESAKQTENKLKRIVRYLTFNGHLLPSFLLFKADTLASKGYRVVPFGEARPVNVFRAKKILYYRLATQEGFEVNFSRIDFFKILANAVWLAILMSISMRKLKVQYLNSLPRLTSKDFWEKYLELETKND